MGIRLYIGVKRRVVINLTNHELLLKAVRKTTNYLGYYG